MKWLASACLVLAVWLLIDDWQLAVSVMLSAMFFMLVALCKPR